MLRWTQQCSKLTPPPFKSSDRPWSTYQKSLFREIKLVLVSFPFGVHEQKSYYHSFEHHKIHPAKDVIQAKNETSEMRILGVFDRFVISTFISACANNTSNTFLVQNIK